MSPFDNTNAIKYLKETWRHQVNYKKPPKLGFFFMGFKHRELQGEVWGCPPHPAGSPCSGGSQGNESGRKSWVCCRTLCIGWWTRGILRSPCADKQELISGQSSPDSKCSQRSGVLPEQWECWESFCVLVDTVEPLLCPSQVTGSGFEDPKFHDCHTSPCAWWWMSTFDRWGNSKALLHSLSCQGPLFTGVTHVLFLLKAV